MSKISHKAKLCLALVCSAPACTAEENPEPPATGEVHAALDESAHVQLCGDWWNPFSDPKRWQQEFCGPLSTDLEDSRVAAFDKVQERFDVVVGYIRSVVRISPKLPFPSPETMRAVEAVNEGIFSWFAATEGRYNDYERYVSAEAARDELSGILSNYRWRGQRLRKDKAAALEATRSTIVAGKLDGPSAEIAALHGAVDDLASQLRTGTRDVAALEERVTAAASRVSALRGQELALFNKASEFVSRASASNLAGLPAIQQELEQWYEGATAQIDELIGEAGVTASDVGWTMSPLKEAFAARATFFASNGLTAPKVESKSAAALSRASAYGVRLRTWVDDVHAALSAGLTARKEALIAAAADQKTRDTFARNTQLKASELFTREANRLVSEASAAFPKTPHLAAPLLSEKVATLTTFLQLEPLCSTESTPTESFRQTGCVALQRQFSRAKSTLNVSIPALLRLNVSTLRRNAIDAAHLAAIESKLAAGATYEAALLADAAFFAIDPLPAAAQVPPPAPASAMLTRSGPERSLQAAVVTKSLEPYEIPEQVRQACKIEHQSRCLISAVITRTEAVKQDERERAATLAVRDAVNKLAKQNTLTEATLTQAIDAQSSFPGDDRSTLLEAFQGTQRTLAQHQAALLAAKQSYNAAAVELEQRVARLEQLPALQPFMAEDVVPSVLDQELPSVALPALSTSVVSNDALAALLTAYSDNVLGALARAQDGAGVTNYAQFFVTAQAWLRNMEFVERLVEIRRVLAPAEVGLVAGQSERVDAAIAPFVDAAGWYDHQVYLKDPRDPGL